MTEAEGCPSCNTAEDVNDEKTETGDPSQTAIRVTYQPYDIGWGCTYRSGQMLVLNTIGGTCPGPPLRKFALWAGPVEVAHWLQSCDPEHIGLGLSLDWDLCLIPMRLGMDAIESRYLSILRKLILHSKCSGAICGVDRRSYYLHRLKKGTDVAYCVDPHLVRLQNIDRVSVDEMIQIGLSSLAPSLCLGFSSLSNEEEKEDLQSELNKLPIHLPVPSDTIGTNDVMDIE